MADPGHRFSGWNALSSMCAAAMPGRNEGGRPNLRHGMQGLLLHRITGVRPPLETTYNTEGASESAQTWNSKAWDSYTYRAKAPKLPQFDRDASSRTRTGTKSIEQFNLGPRSDSEKAIGVVKNARGAHENKPIRGKRKISPERNDSSGQPQKAVSEEKIPQKNPSEEKIPIKDVGKMTQNRGWVSRIKRSFIEKFYSKSTLATKNTKRKKIMEILENMEEGQLPLTPEKITTLAAILDATGMKAGDQYLSEAKAMHIEDGHGWEVGLERQMTTCKRAMQRDKGPETRAKEVRVQDISDDKWEEATEAQGEPKRPSWSYAWAAIWMLRAIEAAQVMAKHVDIDFKTKNVKLYIAKSKTDQKAAGVWRTLACCGKDPCNRACPFALAVKALNEVNSKDGNCTLFPDAEGKAVSKIHMVAAWTKYVDEKATGHSARRSGAMAYAREGTSIHHIQFLGRWKSSAVFRYIEDAMTEMPMNVTNREPKELDEEQKAQQERQQRRALKPKARASPKKEDSPEKKREHKPLVHDEEKEQVYAVSKSRGTSIKHLVGQAAWGIPLDSWTTACGWNFARKNVKVELTKRPSLMAKKCKKCFKLREERDKVMRAREWAQEMKL